MHENGSTYKEQPAKTPADFPPQHQSTQPGSQQDMQPDPVVTNPQYAGSGKLEGRVAVITGGDSGIGQAAAAAFAKEGADLLIAYYSEEEDAQDTLKLAQEQGRKCVLFKCDLRKEESAKQAIEKAVQEFGKIDVLVNNIAVQYPQESLEAISRQQLEDTFATNVYSYFNMAKAALPHLSQGCSIINTTSVTAFQGSPQLIDYSATKGAVVSFTRSLALSLADEGIRVNAVSPGPVWTPLITSSFDEDEVDGFGQDVPLGRAAQPFEIAPAYVYLASDDSAYVTGQVLHVNGGTIVS